PVTPLTYTLSLHDALPIYLDRDGGVHRQHPRHLRHPQPGKTRGSLALVDTRPAPRRRREADLVRPSAPPAPHTALRQRTVGRLLDRKSTRLNSSHVKISYA